MNAPELQRTAYTVECFLNALRLDDGPARTAIEEWLVRWLAGAAHKKGDCVIYRKSSIDCYSGGKVVKSGPLLVEGECRQLNSSGDEIAREGVYALCRCGASRKKPFCDGSHINADFDDAERGRG